MPAQLAHRWTAEEVRALPDEPGTRFECVDGELLVSPSPRITHQSAQGDLYALLRGFCLEHQIGLALIFIEVLSPSTARFDRVVKRKRYQRYGVEYWIVDLDARLVERWMPGDSQPFIHTETITWTPAGVDATLTIDLRPLFLDVLGPA